jgi:hypothetical protein
VVAVVQDSAGIASKHDLKGKKFCHPGYGYETDWTRILSNYLEASVIPQSCETKFTITENRIRASSQFFKSACKAGPWVHNPKLDQELSKFTPQSGSPWELILFFRTKISEFVRALRQSFQMRRF